MNKFFFVLTFLLGVFLLNTPKIEAFELGGGLNFHNYFSDSDTRELLGTKNNSARGFYLYGYFEDIKLFLDAETGFSYARKVSAVTAGNFYKKAVLSEYSFMLRKPLLAPTSMQLNAIAGVGLAEYLSETGINQDSKITVSDSSSKYGLHFKALGNFSYYFGSHGLFAELGIDLLIADKVDGSDINGHGWEFSFGYSYTFGT